jgi:hypothetical protein
MRVSAHARTERLAVITEDVDAEAAPGVAPAGDVPRTQRSPLRRIGSERGGSAAPPSYMRVYSRCMEGAFRTMASAD